MDDEVRQWVRTARASRTLRRPSARAKSPHPRDQPPTSAYDDQALATLPSLSDRVRDIESVLLLLQLHYSRPSLPRSHAMYVD